MKRLLGILGLVSTQAFSQVLTINTEGYTHSYFEFIDQTEDSTWFLYPMETKEDLASIGFDTTGLTGYYAHNAHYVKREDEIPSEIFEFTFNLADSNVTLIHYASDYSVKHSYDYKIDSVTDYNVDSLGNDGKELEIWVTNGNNNETMVYYLIDFDKRTIKDVGADEGFSYNLTSFNLNY